MADASSHHIPDIQGAAAEDEDLDDGLWVTYANLGASAEEQFDSLEEEEEANVHLWATYCCLKDEHARELEHQTEREMGAPPPPVIPNAYVGAREMGAPPPPVIPNVYNGARVQVPRYVAPILPEGPFSFVIHHPRLGAFLARAQYTVDVGGPYRFNLLPGLRHISVPRVLQS